MQDAAVAPLGYAAVHTILPEADSALAPVMPGSINIIPETPSWPAAPPPAAAAPPPAAAAAAAAPPPPLPDAGAGQQAPEAGPPRARGVARARWNNEEEDHLKRLVGEHGSKREWQLISERLGTGRTASGVEQHWQVMTGQRQRNGTTIPKEQQNPEQAKLGELGNKDGRSGAERRTSARWTTEEEAILKQAVGELGKGKWTVVAERLGSGRSPSAVEQHWQIVTGQRKSKGAHAQARATLAPAGAAAPLVPGLGAPVAAVAAAAGGAARDKGGARWNADEEAALGRLVAELGPRGNWLAISTRLDSGRSPGAVEQHWQIMHGARKEGDAGEKRKGGAGAKSRSVAHRWTAEEEASLRRLVGELGGRGKWQAIADRLDSGRTPSGVEQHWKIMHHTHHGTKKPRLEPAPAPVAAAAAPLPALAPAPAVEQAAVAAVEPLGAVAPVVAAAPPPLAPPPPPDVVHTVPVVEPETINIIPQIVPNSFEPMPVAGAPVDASTGLPGIEP